MADLKTNIKLHNRFDIEVIDAKTKQIKQKVEGYNTILDKLWIVFGNNTNNYFYAIFYGSGTGTPQTSDITLFHHEGAVVLSGTNGITGCTYSLDLINGVLSCKRSIQLSESQAVGINLTEVGIGCGTNSTDLCTHAMLQDMNGNPISITKTNTDIINIYATVYVHWSQIGLFCPDSYYEINGRYWAGFRAWLCGTARGDSYVRGIKDGELPCYHIILAKEGHGYGYNATYTANRSYSGIGYTWDATTKQARFTIPRYGVSEGNIGGIGKIIGTNYKINSGEYYCVLQIPMSEFYAGDNITDEAVGTGDGQTTSFALKFDYPTNAKIYVNGIEQTSGVTVRNIPCNSLNRKNAYLRSLRLESTDAINLMAGEPLSDYESEGQNNQRVFCPFLSTGQTLIFRNLLNYIGFASFNINSTDSRANYEMWGSNDLENWTQLGFGRTGANKQNVPLDSTTGFFKYYKIKCNSSQGGLLFNWNADDFKAIEFNTPPADGDVITADYHTPYIAKDEDHVLDISFTLQFGEYTP